MWNLKGFLYIWYDQDPIICEKRELDFFLSNLDAVCFFFLSNCSGSFSIMLHKSRSGHPCLVPDLRGKTFSLLPLSMMFAVGVSYIAFIMLRYKIEFFYSWIFYTLQILQVRKKYRELIQWMCAYLYVYLCKCILGKQVCNLYIYIWIKLVDKITYWGYFLETLENYTWIVSSFSFLLLFFLKDFIYLREREISRESMSTEGEW